MTPRIEAMLAPTPILVIGDEELFTEFMGRFSPRDNRLLFASDLTEALGHCRTSQPELFVLPLDRNHQELTSILTEAFRLDAQVLGLSSNGGEPPEYVTRIAPSGDVEAVFTAAAELLQERRQRPRIRHQLTVDVDGLGTLRSVSLNATSIFVATEAPLDPGVQVTISLRVSDGELSGRAEVTRVGIGEDGNLGMVLVVSPDSATLRHFLESLVRQLLQHEHARRLEDRDLPPAPVAPVDPLSEHQLSALNRALDVIVNEVSALREQVQAGRRGDARLEALERREAEQQERLSEQLDGISGRLEGLRRQQAALDEALTRRAEEAEGGAERLERLEASIAAAQKSASYVEESRAGLKGRLEALERGRAGLNESLELQGEQVTALGTGLKALERSQADLDKISRSQGDQLVALGSGLEQVAEIAASSGLTLEEKKKEILSQVEQAQEAIREELATLCGRVDVAELAQEQGRDELKQGFEALGGDLQRVEERSKQQETLSAEAKTEAHEAREALSQQIELTHAALQALERSIGLQDGHLAALGDRVEALAGLGDQVEALAGLGERVEALAGLGDQVEALAGLGDQVEALAGLGERVEALAELGERVDALAGLGERVDTLEGLGERVDALAGLGERVDALEGLGDQVKALARLGERVDALKGLGHRVEALSRQISEAQQTFGEVRDEVSDLMEAIAVRVEQVAESSAPAEALEQLVKGLAAVGQQQEQLNRTLAEQNTVVVKLVQRLDRIED